MEVQNLLTDQTIAAITGVSSRPVTIDDVCSAFAAVGISPIRDSGEARSSNGVFYARSASAERSAQKTIKMLDLSDPDAVARLLRYTSRIAELYAAGTDAKPERLVRLRNCLLDDGYSIEPAGDPLSAIAALAATASVALSDTAAIRQELTRLERALPDDTSALIGRAKNLVESTSKAVLALRGEASGDDEPIPRLVARASAALGVRVSDAAGPQVDQLKRILGRLHALTHDVAELRNQVGDGHGMATVPAVDAAAGRLAARAAIAWCAFMLEVASEPAASQR